MATLLEPPQATLHARITQLQQKKKNYRVLADHLETLPRKLSHSGLIPVGPRLYLPGQLVRTNEILVLLGKSGEASYFAERSAWQAHEIVRRRQGVVERGLREIITSLGDVQITESKSPPSNLSSSTKLATHRIPASQNPSQHDSPPSLKRRVSFREPLICPSANASPRDYPLSKPQKKNPAKRKPSASAKPVKSSIMEDTRSAQPEPTSTHSPHNTRKDLLAQLGNAVKNAERQALENGVVNIVEVYDKDAHEPSRVEMPPGFQPDQHVDFQPGSTDFLDITTTNKEQPTDVFDGMSRREYLDSLIETEREGEAEELLNDTEQCEDHLKKEEQEFGKGFAKGFFGAPPIQQPSKASSIKSIPNDNPHVTRPVAAPEPDAPFVEELQEIPAVQEKVVEKRKPSRRSAKRNRRKRPQVTPQVPYIPAVDESEGTEQEHPSPQFLPEEDVVEEEDSSVSKFRQLRNFEKAQPNGVQR